MKKEWKGNGNALHAAIAAKKPESETIREQDDFYATDPAALEALLKQPSDWLFAELWYRKRYNKPIWECACGNGNLAKVLSDYGYEVIATDLKNRGYGLTGEHYNFLTSAAQWTHRDTILTVDMIITNPPYSLANEFIKHALEILPENGLYIALMNITYLAGQKRYNEIYSKGSLREVYVFSHRIECWKNGERPKDKCGSIANYAWYVFQKGYKGQPTLYWL